MRRWRRPEPLTPSWFAIEVLIVVVAVLVVVGADAWSGGFDTVNWWVVAAFAIVILAVDIGTARGRQRSERSVS